MPEWPRDERPEWAQDQFTRAQTPDVLRAAVERLLHTWWTLPIRREDRDAILSLFDDLARGRTLATPQEREYDWVECRPGQVRVGEVVRVLADAYGGPAMAHNGRVGRIVAIRSGDIIIDTIDNGPIIRGAHHAPRALEKRVAR